jgi:glycosyltransferase involved in cell wall biosynthesis
LLDETARTDPLTLYGSSKACGEIELQRGLSEAGPELVIYRPTSVMAPDRPVTQSLRRRCAGLVPIVDLDAPLPLVHIENVASAARFLAETVTRPPQFVTHPSEGVTVGDLIEWCGGRPIVIPRRAGRLAVRALELVGTVRPRFAGAARRIDLFLHGQVVQASALAELGWEPFLQKEALGRLFRGGDGKDPLRIAFLITRSDTVGGAHVHVKEIARSLLDRGHDVHVFVGGEGPYCGILRDLDVPVTTVRSLVRPMRPAADRRTVAELRSLITSFDPDLLSTHSSKAGMLGRIAGQQLDVPTLFTAHGWAFADGVGRIKQACYSAAEVIAAPMADRIVCVSEHDRRMARRRGIHLLAPVVAVPNAVRDVSPTLRATPENDPARLVMVARLDAQKCQEEVIEAARRLARHNFSLDFVGDGPREESLRALAARAGIADRTRFLGLRRDVDRVLADSFILMSNYEGMPRSILEAMRAGLPVISSRTAGVPEAVTHGETGFVVPPHQIGALTEALEQLIINPGLRSALGAAGRKRYEERYELSRLVDEMIELYRLTIARSRFLRADPAAGRS